MLPDSLGVPDLLAVDQLLLLHGAVLPFIVTIKKIRQIVEK